MKKPTILNKTILTVFTVAAKLPVMKMPVVNACVKMIAKLTERSLL